MRKKSVYKDPKEKKAAAAAKSDISAGPKSHKRQRSGEAAALGAPAERTGRRASTQDHSVAPNPDPNPNPNPNPNQASVYPGPLGGTEGAAGAGERAGEGARAAAQLTLTLTLTLTPTPTLTLTLTLTLTRRASSGARS